MTIVRGAFNELLRPGLKKIWDESYKVSRKLIEDDLYGFPWAHKPPKRDLRDTPYAEDEWPPKDWPDYP